MKTENKKKLEEQTISIFQDTIKKAGLEEVVNLKIIKSVFKNIGSLKIRKDFESAEMRINLSKAKKEEAEEIYQISQAIFHEIEHAKTLFLTKKEDFYSYEHLISIMEYLYYGNIFKINFEKISMSLPEAYFLKREMNKNYELSSSEIYANLASYLKLQEAYGNEFDREKNKTCSQIIQSLEFLNSNIEIHYNHYGQPINKFMMFTVHAGSYINQNKEVYNQYKILRHLFNNDGTVKSLYDIYLNINEDNEAMYKKIMTGYLASINCDYKESLQDQSFKQYVESLISDYINGTIDYYNNIEKGQIFIDNPKVLSDNLIMKKRNVKILNGIAKKYDLNLTSGTIIDSNNVYCNKLVP